jgi:hypothetical protein
LGFASVLVAGGALTLTVAWAWTLMGGAAPRPDDPVRDTDRALSPAGGRHDELLARWEALRAAFLDVAAPVCEAFDRVDRLRDELRERQDQTRKAESAYLSARRARMLAEDDEAWYVGETAPAEEKTAQGELSQAEWAADQARAKLDELLRTRQRIANAWATQRTSRESAEAAAVLYFERYVKAGELRLQQAKTAAEQAKSRQEQHARYVLAKRMKALHAEVEARRAEELDWQADREKARSRIAQIEARLARSDLSPAEKHLHDLLIQVALEPGLYPLRDVSPAEFRAFLDKFEAGLAKARAASDELRARRYNALADRLFPDSGRTAESHNIKIK